MKRLKGSPEFPISEITEGERARQVYTNMDELMNSITEKGLIQPITIDQDNNLIAGGRRLRACKRLGLSTIPVLIRPTEDLVDALEIELLENQQRSDMKWYEQASLEKRIWDIWAGKDSKWSEEKQAKMTGSAKTSLSRRLELALYLDIMPELKQQETEFQAYTKVKKIFKDHEVKKQAAALSDTPTMPALPVKTDDISEEEIAKHRAQMLWGAAEAAYKVGDALVEIGKGRDESYHFAEVDPPYAIALAQKRQRVKDTHALEQYSEIDAEGYPEFIRTIAEGTFRRLREDTFCIWWFGFEWFPTVSEILRETGFTVGYTPAIWVKGTSGQTNNPNRVLGSAYEGFLIAKKGSPTLNTPGRSNVFQHLPLTPTKKIHPTQRPLLLMKDIIETFCPKRGAILIPFLGSGSTALAATLSNRPSLGFDLNPKNRDHYLSWAAEEIGYEPNRDPEEGD